MIKKFFYVIFFNLIILVIFFTLFEIISRIYYPEFKDNINSKDLIMNKKRHYKKIYGYKYRASKFDKIINIDDHKDGTILIFGDSISDGYGHDYYDIWWKQLERFLKIKDLNYEILAITDFGNNFQNNLDNLKNVTIKAKADNKKIKKIIYQFNYNDLRPKSHDLKFIVNSKNSFFSFENIKKKFHTFRNEQLNKSVFLRTAQHYAGVLVRNTKGTCKDRGLDALGEYTWTYGSKLYAEESNRLWTNFEKNLIDLQKYLQDLEIKFEIVISPILFHIDTKGVHKFYNPYNLDFNCATISPLDELKRISSDQNIKIYDSSEYIKLQFENKISEGNFEPFFFPSDENHFKPIMSKYLAEYISINW